MALVKFYTCTQEQYDALTVNNSFTGLNGALYFTSDTKRLFKGATLYGGAFEYLTSTSGLLYKFSYNGTIFIFVSLINLDTKAKVFGEV